MQNYKKNEKILISQVKNDSQKIFRTTNLYENFIGKDFSLIRKRYIELDYYYVMVEEKDDQRKIYEILKDRSDFISILMKIIQIKYFNNRDIFFYKFYPFYFDKKNSQILFNIRFFDETYIVKYIYFWIEYYSISSFMPDNQTTIPIKIKCTLTQIEGDLSLKFHLIYLIHYKIYLIEFIDETN